MSLEVLGLILLGALLTAIFVGFPIAFTLIILAIIFGYIGLGNKVFYLMVYQTVGLMKEYPGGPQRVPVPRGTVYGDNFCHGHWHHRRLRHRHGPPGCTHNDEEPL
jgi:hypothetical protein